MLWNADSLNRRKERKIQSSSIIHLCLVTWLSLEIEWDNYDNEGSNNSISVTTQAEANVMEEWTP